MFFLPFFPFSLQYFYNRAEKYLTMNSPTGFITWNSTMDSQLVLLFGIRTKLQGASLDPPELSKFLSPAVHSSQGTTFLLRKELLPFKSFV